MDINIIYTIYILSLINYLQFLIVWIFKFEKILNDSKICEQTCMRCNKRCYIWHIDEKKMHDCGEHQWMTQCVVVPSESSGRNAGTASARRQANTQSQSADAGHVACRSAALLRTTPATAAPEPPSNRGGTVVDRGMQGRCSWTSSHFDWNSALVAIDVTMLASPSPCCRVLAVISSIAARSPNVSARPSAKVASL